MGANMILIIIIAVVVLIFVEGSLRDRRLKEAFRVKLKEDYGKISDKELSGDDISRIGTYHKSMSEAYPERFFIDDITWNDLAMDDIFRRMDRCMSSVGEEELYHRLHSPVLKEDDDHSHFCRMSVYFDENEEERIRVQEILNDIGINRKTSITRVYDYVSVLKSESNGRHYLMIALVLISIGMIFVVPGIGVILFLLFMFISIGSYLKTKKEIEPLIVTFNYTARMVRACEKLAGIGPSVLKEDLEQLAEYKEPLKGIMSKSVWISSSTVSMDNPVMLLLEYIKMIFHVDLIIINRLVDLLKKHVSDIDGIRRVLGGIDASIASASYRRSLVRACTPEFTGTDKAVLSLDECIHPLVSEPVPNSIDVSSPILLTGSNASGKSTFLKTVAISALLAQTVGYAPCKEYRASWFKIYTSMALNDSIRNGESYFIVEIKSIKRIMDAPDDTPVLCCIDEVLRGTNTVERIAASTQILKSLIKPLSLPFAATHDIELTRLLEGYYRNYHFEEEVSGNDVKFNYQLMTGSAKTRNAIKLLSVMDYDRTMISEAERMVEEFMNSGVWEEKPL